MILNVNNLHWVCVANMDSLKSDNSVHNLYDSLVSRSLSFHIKEQISSFSHCDLPEINVNVIPVQQQSNGVDCGVFSIAFATALAHGFDPSEMSFDLHQMRPHLLKCFAEEYMTPFPTTKKRITKCGKKTERFPVYCICRMPYKPEDDMVQCEKCECWYHFTCMRVKKKDIKKTWICSICKL